MCIELRVHPRCKPQALKIKHPAGKTSQAHIRRAYVKSTARPESVYARNGRLRYDGRNGRQQSTVQAALAFVLHYPSERAGHIPILASGVRGQSRPHHLQLEGHGQQTTRACSADDAICNYHIDHSEFRQICFVNTSGTLAMQVYKGQSTHLEGIQHGTAGRARSRCRSERLQAHGLEQIEREEVERLLGCRPHDIGQVATIPACSLTWDSSMGYGSGYGNV